MNITSKYLKLISLFLILFIVQLVSYAQDCKVIDPNLLGVYTGDCKNGKAEGQGKSVGLHSYEGEFKAGLPDGEGIYTDEKGSVFKGQFKKGKREGYGEYIIKNGSASSRRLQPCCSRSVISCCTTAKRGARS